MRMWSVNTWLIVICVGVFVVDGFLPLTYFKIGAPMPLEGVSSIPSTAVMGDITRERIQTTDSSGQPRTEIIVARPIYASTQGPLIAYQEVAQMSPIQGLLHFSSHELVFGLGFWRLIGFQFLHANLTHLIFNMIGLYFFGPMVERYLGSKRYLAFYLLCGICGALLYGVLNLGGALTSMYTGASVQIPGLLFDDMATPLIGASAGVYGVIMAGAFLVPNATVLLFFILPMRLATLAYFIVGIAIFTLLTRGENAGGEAAHIGGALAGFYFIRHPKHLHGFFDFLGRIDPTSHHYRGKGAPMRARAMAKGAKRIGSPNRAAVDRVLDKVHNQGLASLTEKEKRLLREASERDR